MTAFVRFKSKDYHRPQPVWEVIRDGARAVDIRSLDSGRVLYSVSKDRLDAVTEPENQEPTP